MHNNNIISIQGKSSLQGKASLQRQRAIVTLWIALFIYDQDTPGLYFGKNLHANQSGILKISSRGNMLFMLIFEILL